MALLAGILLTAAGLLMLLRPEGFFALTEGWKSDRAGEPSSLYRFSTRFGGAVLLAVGTTAILSYFFL